MEKKAVIDPKVTPSLKETNASLAKEASAVEKLDADITKRLAEKVKDDTVSGGNSCNRATCGCRK